MPSKTPAAPIKPRDRRYNGDIVISGMSGRFPDCESVEEFKDALYNNDHSLIREGNSRWPTGYRGVVNCIGQLKNLGHLDASYFGIHSKLANRMDPQLRILLESTHEALMDAGVNPTSIRGSNIGVYVAVNNSEALDIWSRNLDDADGYTMMGCHTTMMANRISHAFDFRGPSCAMNTACSSSLYALNFAYQAIRNGDCDAAIVGASNLVLVPTSSLYFTLLGLLDAEGQSRPLEDDARGYVRAEGIVTVFLQKSCDSKRIYAKIMGVKTNADGYKEQGIMYPSGAMQSKLIRELYDEIDLELSKVSYIETHTGGTKVGDTEEINWIVETFRENRQEPLLIGCVKSLMGHAEHASGLCSLVKIILAMEIGVIPPNLNFKSHGTFNPNLADGKVKVVVKNEPWKGGIMAMNAFGFGGTNSHLVLKSNPKPKINLADKTNLPRIVGVSGRTVDAVHYFLDNIELHKADSEFLGLLDSIHSCNIRGHPVRGFTIRDGQSTKHVGTFGGEGRPVWFVYSGIGTQWSTMAKDVMVFDEFKKSVRRSAQLLKSHGIDLEYIMTESDHQNLDVLEAMVCITAIQVALTDLLASLDITADGIIGISTGEIAAAYADGSLTADQAILTAYARGYALKNTALPEGSMSAVELGWDEAMSRCPSGVHPVCDNGIKNVTVAGPTEAVKKFETRLAEEGLFATTIRSLGYAFHSEYIADSTQLYRQMLEEIITHPRVRSPNWRSTSIPEPEWNSKLAKLASVDYFVNSSVSPVRFRQAMGHVPENAIVVEVAPTGAMQSVIKSSTSAKTTSISLMKNNYEDNVNFFLSALGHLYIAGAQPKFGLLYEPVTFPVSKGTPRIASMVKWDHSIEWDVPKYNTNEARNEIIINIDLKQEPLYTGHVVGGKIFFPVSGYLVFVWKSYANLLGTNYEETPVIFEDVKLLRGTVLAFDASIRFTLSLMQQTGYFEIREKATLVVTGRVYVGQEKSTDELVVSNCTSHTKAVMNSSEVYKELRLRGYEYDGLFCGITEYDCERNSGCLKWDRNWVTFIDNVLQFDVLCQNTRDLLVIVSLQRLSIDPKKHLQVVNRCAAILDVPVYSHPILSLTKSGGVALKKIEYRSRMRRAENQRVKPRLTKYQFVPYINTVPFSNDENPSRKSALDIISQIVAENLFVHSKIRIIEFTNNNTKKSLLLPEITQMLELNMIHVIAGTTITIKPQENGNQPQRKQNEIMLQDLSSFKPESLADLIIVLDTLPCIKSDLLTAAKNSLSPDGFILVQGNRKNPTTKLPSLELTTVAVQVTQSETFSLLKRPYESTANNSVIQIREKDFSWVDTLKKTMSIERHEHERVYLFSEGEDASGIIGLVNCLRWEAESECVRSFLIRDNEAPAFAIQAYNEQVKKDLVHNVLQDSTWGCYCHVEFEDVDKLYIKESQFAYADILKPGNLSSITWLQAPPSYLSEPNSEAVSVYYASLNFKDAMIAMGERSRCSSRNYDMTNLCQEFSGRKQNGRRVMGLNVSNSMATTVAVNPDHLLDVPDDWTLQEAATVPVAYATCYYALVIKGRLQPRESILVHTGSAAVGMAALSIALDMDCTVFTTVSSQAKRKFLKDTFPRLQERHIGDSQDTSFEKLVLLETNGAGVNLILNSLPGELLHASLNCLSEGGRFIDLGTNYLTVDASININNFLKNKSFHGISLSELMCNEYDLQNILRLMKDGIASGQVKPLPNTVFTENQVEEAFRLLTSANQTGKILVQIRNEESEKGCLPKPRSIMARPRTYMHYMKTYIIIGGLGGFGMELANWLVNRGAKNIILTTRSGIKTGYQYSCIKRWKESNINVIISNNDAASEGAARDLLQQAIKIGPIGGIFNVAFTLQDALLKNQTKEAFQAVCIAKVTASRNLDIASRELAPDLDHFVLFSSIVSAKGNIGQSNYGFANSSMERLCEARWKCGLPSLTIQWGLLADVGHVVEKMGHCDIEVSGTIPQRISSCLASLDLFLQQSNPVVTSVVLPVRNKAAKQITKCNIIDTVLKIVGVKDVNAISSTVTIAELGIDSLMEVEIKQTLERNYNVRLTSKEIRNLTTSKLLKLSSGLSTTDFVQNGQLVD